MMDPAPRQLPLDLPVETRFGREDYLVGTSNEAAVELIQRWPDWPSSMMIIVGPQGSGKSHLAAIWAAASSARIIQAHDLGGAQPATLARAAALVIEDLDTSPLAEASLFHLINLLRETATPLVMTARSRPGQWGLAIPDLLSRLRLAPLAEIAPPDDAMLRALMVKLFVDRQILVDVGVVDYVLARIERSFAGVAAAVHALDNEALALGRRITRPVAARVLDSLNRDED